MFYILALCEYLPASKSELWLKVAKMRVITKIATNIRCHYRDCYICCYVLYRFKVYLLSIAPILNMLCHSNICFELYPMLIIPCNKVLSNAVK